MNFFIGELIQKILVFAGDFPSITAETNEERVEQLLRWVENLQEDPWPEGEGPFITFEEAKKITFDIRNFKQ